MGEPQTDIDLLDRTDADPQAFGDFYRRHAKPVLIYIGRRVRDAEAAADLTAEVFAIALESRHAYSPERGPARAWLFGIAANLMARSRRNGYREARARRRLGMPPLAADDAELQRIEELIDADRTGVRPLLAELPDAEREAVLARIVEEREYRTISHSTGVSEPALRQRVHRGLARMALAMRKEP